MPGDKLTFEQVRDNYLGNLRMEAGRIMRNMNLALNGRDPYGEDVLPVRDAFDRVMSERVMAGMKAARIDGLLPSDEYEAFVSGMDYLGTGNIGPADLARARQERQAYAESYGRCHYRMAVPGSTKMYGACVDAYAEAVVANAKRQAAVRSGAMAFMAGDGFSEAFVAAAETFRKADADLAKTDARLVSLLDSGYIDETKCIELLERAGRDPKALDIREDAMDEALSERDFFAVQHAEGKDMKSFFGMDVAGAYGYGAQRDSDMTEAARKAYLKKILDDAARAKEMRDRSMRDDGADYDRYDSEWRSVDAKIAAAMDAGIISRQEARTSLAAVGRDYDDLESLPSDAVRSAMDDIGAFMGGYASASIHRYDSDSEPVRQSGTVFDDPLPNSNSYGRDAGESTFMAGVMLNAWDACRMRDDAFNRWIGTQGGPESDEWSSMRDAYERYDARWKAVDAEIVAAVQDGVMDEDEAREALASVGRDYDNACPTESEIAEARRERTAFMREYAMREAGTSIGQAGPGPGPGFDSAPVRSYGDAAETTSADVSSSAYPAAGDAVPSDDGLGPVEGPSSGGQGSGSGKAGRRPYVRVGGVSSADVMHRDGNRHDFYIVRLPVTSGFMSDHGVAVDGSRPGSLYLKVQSLKQFAAGPGDIDPVLGKPSDGKEHTVDIILYGDKPAPVYYMSGRNEFRPMKDVFPDELSAAVADGIASRQVSRGAQAEARLEAGNIHGPGFVQDGPSVS